MPWIEADGPFAALPRTVDPVPTRPWNGSIDVDGRWAELEHTDVSGATIEAPECDELVFNGCRLARVTISPAPQTRVTLIDCVVVGCDLSGLTIDTVRASTISDSKLTGTVLSDGTIDDTRFDRCSFRVAHMRMARLRRVAFDRCTLDDVDLFSAAIEHAQFPGSSLTDVNVDGVAADHVDLREAVTLGLVGVSRLDGFLVSPVQLYELAPLLAHATGLGIAHD